MFFLAVYSTDSSPGPRYHVDPKITHFGRDCAPAYSILGRMKEQSGFFLFNVYFLNTFYYVNYLHKYKNNCSFKKCHFTDFTAPLTFDCSLVTRAAPPHAWTRCIQPWESTPMQPAAQTPSLHNGLSYTVPHLRPRPCSQQVQPASTSGPSCPKQASQCQLHHVR